MKEYKYMVCTQCMTYNQNPFIEDALSGFSMQETTFPVVYVIVDDASTDGEPDVLKQWCEKNLALDESGVAYRKTMEYGDLTYARHKEHKNLFFAVLLLSFNHYSNGLKQKKLEYIKYFMDCSKYFALCEGDDYWIHSNKIQRQVDFLESNPDYTMCFHKAYVKIESGDYSGYDNSMYDGLEEREYSGIELAKKWQVPTASIMYRSIIRPPQDKKLLTGDIPLVLQCAMEGRVFCFAEPMSVYRRTSGGVTLNKYTTMQIVDKMLAYIRWFPPFKSVYKNVLITMMQSMIYSSHCYEAIKLVEQRKKLIFYFVAGLTKGFIQMPQRIINKILK